MNGMTIGDANAQMELTLLHVRKPLAGTILIKKFGDLKEGPLLILIERNSEYEIAFEAFLCCFAWSADTNAYVDREQVAPVRRPPVVEIGVEGAPPLIEALVDLDFGIFGRELQELKPETIRLNLLRGEPVFVVPPPSFPRPRSRPSHGNVPRR